MFNFPRFVLPDL